MTSESSLVPKALNNDERTMRALERVSSSHLDLDLTVMTQTLKPITVILYVVPKASHERQIESQSREPEAQLQYDVDLPFKWHTSKCVPQDSSRQRSHQTLDTDSLVETKVPPPDESIRDE